MHVIITQLLMGKKGHGGLILVRFRGLGKFIYYYFFVNLGLMAGGVSSGISYEFIPGLSASVF